ncbi:glycosyltransferase family 4 protein [Microbispora sp. KK1-11]|uniref:glycosyltransferase family 4 protein n=1 Tax=Microbispora sp. KK1-11 TaxID=2053005 RepID=UPI0011587D03|nr:glycosyltransferase family 4 protein [Microbispora sp. KK1-11]TQS30064.1 glycosyltransferase family 4 protein [Microbispora sp. KK1-11]
MRLFGWQADRAGCAWWRIVEPFKELATRGHAVGHDVRYTAEWDDADTVLAQRTCMPGPTGSWQEWARQGRHIVYDLDDDLFSVELGAPNGRFFNQPEVQQRIRDNIAAACRVTVCSERLAEVLAPLHDDVRVVPNGVPAYLLDRPMPAREGRLTVGWAGTPSTLAELSLAVRPLRRLLDRRADVEVHTLGLPAEAIREARLQHSRVRCTPPIHDPDAYLAAVDFDVWVAPYRSTAFNRAKAPTKALEAAALGIPIIASDIEPYRRFVRHGETGFLVRQDHEWDAYLRELCDDDLRQRMGKAARELAREHTTEAIAPLWEEALTP